jgi:hypothetical protein
VEVEWSTQSLAPAFAQAIVSYLLHHTASSNKESTVILDLQGLVPGLMLLPQLMYTQVPYVKWHSICKEPMYIYTYTFNHL